MSELRLFVRRDSLRDNEDCPWVLRHDDGRVIASGNGLEGLPKARHCRLVLAADMVSILPARLPDWSPRKLAPLLKGAVEDLLLGDAEQFHVAWLGRDDQGLSWLAATDAAWLKNILSRLAGRGVAVEAALPESLLLTLEDKSWSLVMHEDGALLRTSRTLGLALDQGLPPAGLLLALGNPDALHGGLPERLCVYQGSAMQSPDAARWHEACGLPVEHRGPWNWRDVVWPAGLDVLQGGLGTRRDGINLSPLLRPILLAGVALAAIQVIGMTLDWALLSVEQRALQTKVRQLAESVLPANAAIADPAWQIGVKLDALRAANGHESGGMVSLLGLVGKARPAGGSHDLTGVTFESGRLDLEYAHADADWLGKFRSALSASGLAVSVAPSTAGGVTLAIRAASAPAEKGQDHGR